VWPGVFSRFSVYVAKFEDFRDGTRTSCRRSDSGKWCPTNPNEACLITHRAKNGRIFCRWKRQSENVMVVLGQLQKRQLSQTSCGKSTLLKPQQHIPAPGYGACEVFGRMSHLRNNAGSFCTARRYASTGYQVCRDDGIIDPADTRRVLGLALAAATQHRPTPTHYGVFRF